MGASLGVGGCAWLDYPLPKGMSGVTSAIAPKPAQPSWQTRQYIVGPGDELLITQNEARLATATVTEQGIATLPRKGDTQVAGSSLDEIASAIDKNKSIAVTLSTSPDIFIIGAVAHPGAFAYTSGTTLGSVLTAAGGTTYKTDMRIVWIKAHHANAESEVAFDPSLPILPGDIVRLKERY
jgi:polysaccharide export outer membrane protein